MYDLVLTSYPDGQVVILDKSDFDNLKEYYGLTKICDIQSPLSKDEIDERMIEPLAFPDTWFKEKQWKYKSFCGRD